MAKKAKKPKAAKKAAPKKAAKVVKMTPKAKVKVRKPSPRSQVLPGMEQVRNRSLDRICEGISETRADMNRLRGEDKDLMMQGVKVMQADEVTAYRFAGVELVLVPGDVKLRVRTMKAGDVNGDGAAEETGSGQDAGEIAESLTAGDDAAAPEGDDEP